jgi:hypothetical protein
MCESPSYGERADKALIPAVIDRKAKNIRASHRRVLALIQCIADFAHCCGAIQKS